ncbi:Spy/CpxP family protein refolding chaperone [Prosthecobacter vanneervenii]|uniref:Spy/CpxP family protein refolding chaperone n=1 Tax=Prosthecobacter vanneervenii TaxID=48466 RepID=A0A7W8DML6_9BACT|nr:periplasmic heavy metal sensor [Prosthecobacter vanneervenii]MBB5035387.1 Spy/CpxP family protein refolding chaperone [Prosthecobacter vanneervenii]
MKTLLCSLLLLTACALPAAQVEEWLKSGLLHPDLITSVRDQLALTEEQQSKLNAQLSEARAQAEPLEQAVKEQKKALNQLLKDRTSTAEAAAAQLSKLLEAEGAIKQLQLRTLIAVRDVLTPEQLAKAQKLNPPGQPSPRAGLEARVDEKAHKLRAAVESLGISPTEAMKYRGEEIEGLIKSGQLAEADAKLDELIKDSHFKELDAEVEKVDFSKFEPGSTDLETLRERFERLQVAGQAIISLPLLREMLQAKSAFEEAKEAQDAEKVGRILTYAEERLKKNGG